MTADDAADRVKRWWRTSIIDMRPGEIRVRGYAIQDLIGRIDFGSMIWLMLRGELPTAAHAELLEAALVAAVDHGPQAPSIAIARMTVTAGNDLNHAVGAAITSLGDVHGGAGQQCMELLQDAHARLDGGLSVQDAAAAAVQGYRGRHGRFVPGFGHRFHPVDPRAPRLLELVYAARDNRHVAGRFAALARAVESELSGNGRHVPMNIDGATAVIFSELGFAPPLGRGLFILSRAVGILAHAWEQSCQGERIKGPVPPEFLFQYDGEPARALPFHDKGGYRPG